MTDYRPDELARALQRGLLSFPVTPFDAADGSLDRRRYREHLAWLAEHPVAGLFAAGGTGEVFSLDPGEIATVVADTVAEVAGRVPVLAPASGGTRSAIAQARAAEQAGADGILLFPPYLTEADQRGLAAHVSAVAEVTSLGIVLYARANARYEAPTIESLAARHENLIGYKDGIGEIDRLTRIVTALGDRLVYVGGMPTAEIFASAYRAIGVQTYSSALFNFLPEFALSFHAAVREDDGDVVRRGLAEFVLPYAAIRDRRAGYAVSIVKAGLSAVGRPAGPVRPPLVDLDADEIAELRALIERSGVGRAA